MDSNDARPLRLAVLIDADNASASVADRLFEEIAKLGEATVRRIYGDFTRSHLKGWADVLSRLAIIPHQQFAYTTGKNASDMALVIDAMSLLYSGNVDGFCLVSSDSDFTRLAAEIRERGLLVYGFGEQKTPESLRNACHRFIYLENLSLDAAETEAAKGKRARTGRLPPSKAVPLILTAIEQLESDDGWVTLSAVGSQLGALKSDFDPRTYGERKLSDLVRKSGGFEVERRETRGVCIRAKADA
jgi:uncharacterized LabA/DUF88 family protein